MEDRSCTGPGLGAEVFYYPFLGPFRQPRTRILKPTVTPSWSKPRGSRSWKLLGLAEGESLTASKQVEVATKHGRKQKPKDEPIRNSNMKQCGRLLDNCSSERNLSAMSIKFREKPRGEIWP